MSIDHFAQSGNSTLRSALERYLELTQLRHVEKGRMQAEQRRRRQGRIPTPAELKREAEELDAFEVAHAIPCEVARDTLIAAVLTEHNLNPRSTVFAPVASIVEGRLILVGLGERCQSVELFVVNFDDVHGARRLPSPSRPAIRC